MNLGQWLESFAPKLQNEWSRWFTDNQNVVRILMTGSIKALLHAEALSIFSNCLHNYIALEPE